eukprot:gene23507-biopygen7298
MESRPPPPPATMSSKRRFRIWGRLKPRGVGPLCGNMRIRPVNTRIWCVGLTFPQGQKSCWKCGFSRQENRVFFAKFRAHPSQPRAKTVARKMLRTPLERGPRLSLQRHLRQSWGNIPGSFYW